MPASPLLRRAALTVALALALIALAATVARPAAASLEGALLDVSLRAARRPASALVAWVDSGSSFDRGAVARAVRALREAGARAIVIDEPLEQPDRNPDLERVQGFLSSPESRADPALAARLGSWAAELDHDARLEAAIKDAPVILLARPGAEPWTGPVLAGAAAGWPALAGITPPLARFLGPAQGMGVDPVTGPDADGVRRRDAVAAGPAAGAWPSLALAAWLAAGPDAPGDVRWADSRTLVALHSGRRLALGAGGNFVPQYAAPAGDPDGVPRLMLEAVVAGQFDAAQVKDRVVVLGHGPSWATPVGARPAAEVLADRIGNLADGAYLVEPGWRFLAQVAVWLLAILWAAVAQWKVVAAQGWPTVIAATAGLVIAVLAAEVVLLVGNAWVTLALPALAIPLIAVLVAAAAPWLGAAPGQRQVRDPVLLVPDSPIVLSTSRPAERAPPAPPPRPARASPSPGAARQPDPWVTAPPQARPAPPARAAPARTTLAPATPQSRPTPPGPATPQARVTPQAGAAPQISPSLRQLTAGVQALEREPSRDDVADRLMGRAKRAPRPMLGRYELTREVGRGAMGTVFLARDPRLNRTVAIKAIPIAEEFEERDVAELRTRFVREAEMAARLSHPGIVTVFDAGEDGALAYIAMEYVDGRLLSEFTASDRLLPPPQVLEILARVADALDYAHAQGIVHRDVKPANLIFDPDTLDTKIMDFGIARLTNSSATRTGIVLGTPSFMSPEQLEGRIVTGRSDLFSLGVTLFQLLAGQLPFRADSMTGLMDKIANAGHPPLRAIRPELPPCVAGIVDRLLAKDPAKRFNAAGEVAQALRACAGTMPS
jgi:eukaryotic-like serine/threonine-protein kinase